VDLQELEVAHAVRPRLLQQHQRGVAAVAAVGRVHARGLQHLGIYAVRTPLPQLACHPPGSPKTLALKARGRVCLAAERVAAREVVLLGQARAEV